jgi:outer membrane protein TolC
LAAGLAVAVPAQSANQSSASNPFYGSVTVGPVTDQPLQLSLDEAIRRGLETNLGLREALSQELAIHGEQNQALQEFLPTITLTGDSGYYEHNLAALGFKPSLFPTNPGAAKLPSITKNVLHEGTIHFNQILFSGPVISGWRAAGAATRAAYFNKMSARGEVVQQVATAYLRAIAAASEAENSRALEQADLVQFNHAHEQHQAGVAPSLDELRARVQYQTQQQVRIAAENSYEKFLIALKREIGVDPGQKIVLADRTPYSDLAAQTPDEVRALAYKYRQDYQRTINERQELKSVHSAYRSQRLPTLSFSGNYGVQDIPGVGAHGNFAAIGNLSFPIFREASLRGDIQASEAQLRAIDSQLDDLRSRIDQQVRSALLDVNAARKLVEVSQSNVDLATRALADQTERTNAGVDDTLPLVRAQASLASAQTRLVESLYQYNVSKLALARAAGVLETQYRAYLGQ